MANNTPTLPALSRTKVGYRMMEAYKDEIRKLFTPIEEELWNMFDSDIVELKAYEILGPKAKALYDRKKELEEELAEIEEGLRKYNGDSCSFRKMTTNSFRSPYRSKDDTPIEDASWQAKELLYPEIKELATMKEEALRNITFCEATDEVKVLVQEIQKNLDKLLNTARSRSR